MTVGLADAVFMLGTMNINEAFFGIGIMRIEPVQPQNPRSNQILCVRQWLTRPQSDPASEHGAAGHAVANFLCYLETAEWGFVASDFSSHAKPRARDGIRPRRLVTTSHSEGLVPDRYLDFAPVAIP